MYRLSLRWAVFLAISLLNGFVALYHVGVSRLGTAQASTTYLERNHPIEFPLPFDTVSMTLLRNTTRFNMDLSDHASRLEWTTLSEHPFVVHVGETRRAFQVALFHQLHCVHVMEETFLRGEYHGLNSHHIQHCGNYLRQSFLCNADDSLEDGDFLDQVEDRNGGTKICRDWEMVYTSVDKNLKDWHEWHRMQTN